MLKRQIIAVKIMVHTDRILESQKCPEQYPDEYEPEPYAESFEIDNPPDPD